MPCRPAINIEFKIIALTHGQQRSQIIMKELIKGPNEIGREDTKKDPTIQRVQIFKVFKIPTRPHPYVYQVSYAPGFIHTDFNSYSCFIQLAQKVAFTVSLEMPASFALITSSKLRKGSSTVRLVQRQELPFPMDQSFRKTV